MQSHPPKSVGLRCKGAVTLRTGYMSGVTSASQNTFAGAKVQKKYGLGKFCGEKVWRKWILQGKYEKTRSLWLRVGELCHGLDDMSANFATIL